VCFLPVFFFFLIGSFFSPLFFFFFFFFQIGFEGRFELQNGGPECARRRSPSALRLDERPSFSVPDAGGHGV
jgi:hypothetical protein